MLVGDNEPFSMTPYAFGGKYINFVSGGLTLLKDGVSFFWMMQKSHLNPSTLS